MPRFRATATVTWEYECGADFEEAHAFAVEEFKKVADVSTLENSRVSFAIHQVKWKPPSKVSVGEFDPYFVLRKIRDDSGKEVFVAGGKEYAVRMNSDRYLLFRRDRKCAACGLEGKVMVLERKSGDGNFHFNLYAEDDKGERVLMTKDHVKAKAYGGTDTLDNYATLCAPCNTLKASYSLSYDEVRVLRAMKKNPDALPPKELNKKIQARRIVNQDFLNGQ